MFQMVLIIFAIAALLFVGFFMGSKELMNEIKMNRLSVTPFYSTIIFFLKSSGSEIKIVDQEWFKGHYEDYRKYLQNERLKITNIKFRGEKK